MTALLLTTLFAIASAGSPETTHDAPDREHSLGGVAIGQSESSMVNTLGSPMRRSDNDDGALPITIHYNGLVVFLDEQGVGGIRSTSKRFCTPSKVCPGMSVRQVRKIYGAPVSTRRDNATLLHQYFLNDGCWVQLTENDKVISSVEVLCSP